MRFQVNTEKETKFKLHWNGQACLMSVFFYLTLRSTGIYCILPCCAKMISNLINWNKNLLNKLKYF